MSSLSSISAEKLARLIGLSNAPTIIDIRTEAAFAADARLIPGSARRVAHLVAEWVEIDCLFWRSEKPEMAPKKLTEIVGAERIELSRHCSA